MNSLILYDPLCIPDGHGEYIFIDPASIMYVEASNKRAHIFCTNKVEYKNVSLTLLEVQSRLPKRLFYRVHNSYLVSRSYIRRMNDKKTRLFLVDNSWVQIGRTFQTDFLKKFRMR